MRVPSFTPAVDLPERPAASSLLVVARGLEVVVARDGEAFRLPTLEEAEDLGDGLHALGTLDGTPCLAAALRDVPLPPPFELVAARSLYGHVDETTFMVAGRAIAVVEWDRTHRFCGRCGNATSLVPGERARRCAACDVSFYPRISPAVIVLVEKGEEILLARNAAFQRPWFSTLAGFVEPGESLEETVHREVREEVGVELDELRYFGSQPWPFGRSLMIGFHARYAGGEVRVDGTEIAEARWFRADALPLIPPKLSIARQLIDDWLARRGTPP